MHTYTHIQAKADYDKLMAGSVAPLEYFKSQTDKYSQFDAQGVPTHNSAGEELSKSQKKVICFPR
jgi:cysteinyl-tRNA synthetase